MKTRAAVLWGLVVEVGGGVEGVSADDPVVLSFLPACGHCSYCAGGMTNLCDLGAALMSAAPSSAPPTRSTTSPARLEMYDTGQLKLGELVTREYRLEEINQGYDDMRAGRNVRGLVGF